MKQFTAASMANRITKQQARVYKRMLRAEKKLDHPDPISIQVYGNLLRQRKEQRTRRKAKYVVRDKLEYSS